MTFHFARILITLILFCSQVYAQAYSASDQVVEQLQSEAISSDLAWELLASLTSEVGPEMGGTEAQSG